MAALAKEHGFTNWNLKREDFVQDSVKRLLQHYHMQIAAIQETKWMGNNVYDTKTHTVLQSGKEKGKREFGAAFIVNKAMKKILAFAPVIARICVLRLKTRFFDLSMISAVAPTEDEGEGEKDQFYCLLNRTYGKAPLTKLKW
jgi:hypothetical protein